MSFLVYLFLYIYMENYGKWKVEKSLYNNPKIAIKKKKRGLR